MAYAQVANTILWSYRYRVNPQHCRSAVTLGNLRILRLRSRAPLVRRSYLAEINVRQRWLIPMSEAIRPQVALVTGSATGIGRATALLLARRGLAVAVNYSRSENEAKETLKQVKSLGVAAILCRC